MLFRLQQEEMKLYSHRILMNLNAQSFQFECLLAFQVPLWLDTPSDSSSHSSYCYLKYTHLFLWDYCTHCLGHTHHYFWASASAILPSLILFQIVPFHWSPGYMLPFSVKLCWVTPALFSFPDSEFILAKNDFQRGFHNLACEGFFIVLHYF